MNAKVRFSQHLRGYVAIAQLPAKIAILGSEDYDQLFSEVATSVADFQSCSQSQVSLEFQRQGVAHFYYRGILVIRSPGSREGFHFA
jgi:hypothetical protein